MPATAAALVLLAQATGTTESAPWWGVPVVAGTFLIIGGVLGHQFNKRQEDRKAERALSERYMDQRLEHCSNLLEEARAVKEKLGEAGVWPAEATPSSKVSEKVTVARDLIRGACKRAMSSYSSITLIAPETLRKPARSVVVGMMYARILSTSQQARDTQKSLSAAIQQFEAAGRKHFGAGEEEAPKPVTDEPAEEQGELTRFRRWLAWWNETL